MLSIFLTLVVPPGPLFIPAAGPHPESTFVLLWIRSLRDPDLRDGFEVESWQRLELAKDRAVIGVSLRCPDGGKVAFELSINRGNVTYAYKLSGGKRIRVHPPRDQIGH